MEGMAWLLLKLAVLLALAGGVFFSFGWWSRGGRARLIDETLRNEIEQQRAAARAAQAEREAARQELESTKARLTAAAQEFEALQRDQVHAQPSAAVPAVAAAKPKTKARPSGSAKGARGRKKKQPQPEEAPS